MNKEKVEISVIIPMYRCSAAVYELYCRLVAVLSDIVKDFEIIFVNDASPENDWEIITHISETDRRVKGISLSRNFGQHYAITAGAEYCTGNWIVVMDGDLQDPPEDIAKLYRTALKGNDIVFGRRIERKDVLVKRISSYCYHRVFDYLTETKTDNKVANFSIVSRIVINEFRRHSETSRSYPNIIDLLGFTRTYIDIEHNERFSGRSSYSLRKRMSLAMDVILAHSNKPLKISIGFGFFLFLTATVYALYLTIRYFIVGTPVEGWTSVMVSIYLMAGLLFAAIGMVGLYIGKIFDQVKNRPLYIVKDTINIESSNIQ